MSTRTSEIDACGCLALVGLMRAIMIVMREIARQAIVYIGHLFVVHEVDVFVFHTSPKSFNEHVVEGSATTSSASSEFRGGPHEPESRIERATPGNGSGLSAKYGIAGGTYLGSPGAAGRNPSPGERMKTCSWSSAS